jgi:hypothetical protein
MTMARFGERKADGEVIEPTECILTGRLIAAPYDTTVSEPVSGTRFFYRVYGSQYHRVTDEMRATWAAESKPVEKQVYGGRNRSAEKIEVSE